MCRGHCLARPAPRFSRYAGPFSGGPREAGGLCKRSAIGSLYLLLFSIVLAKSTGQPIQQTDSQALYSKSALRAESTNAACRIHHRPRPLPRHTRTGGSACCPPWIRLSGRLQNPPLHLSSPRLDDISARKHAGGRPPCGGRGSGGVGGLGRHRCRSEVRLLADPEKPEGGGPRSGTCGSPDVVRRLVIR